MGKQSKAEWMQHVGQSLKGTNCKACGKKLKSVGAVGTYIEHGVTVPLPSELVYYGLCWKCRHRTLEAAANVEAEQEKIRNARN